VSNTINITAGRWRLVLWRVFAVWWRAFQSGPGAGPVYGRRLPSVFLRVARLPAAGAGLAAHPEVWLSAC
jgi:hypothetical protein